MGVEEWEVDGDEREVCGRGEGVGEWDGEVGRGLALSDDSDDGRLHLQIRGTMGHMKLLRRSAMLCYAGFSSNMIWHDYWFLVLCIRIVAGNAYSRCKNSRKHI